MGRSVEKIYGNALYDACVSASSIDRVLSEAEMLLSAYEGKTDLAALSRDLSDEMKGLYAAVLDKGRELQMPGILRHFISRAKEEKGIGSARVVTAVPLTEEKKEEIRKKLAETTRYREVEAEFTVDPDLIGGIVISTGGRMVDGSVRTKLDKMKNSLLKLKL